MLAEPTAACPDVETEWWMLVKNAIMVVLTLPTELAETANSQPVEMELLIDSWVSNVMTPTTFLGMVVPETAHLNAEMAVLRAMRPVMMGLPTVTLLLLIPVPAVLLVNSRAAVMVLLTGAWVSSVMEQSTAEPTVL